MKKSILFTLFLSLSLAGLQAQEAKVISVERKSAEGREVLVMKQTEHDFGSIAQNKPVYFDFILENHSDSALRIENVQATCGCTTPEWNKEPVAPGGSDRIKVGYNAAAEGPFEKYITVVYNGNQTKQVKIKGNVWKAPQGAAPSNPGLQFLKQQIQ